MKKAFVTLILLWTLTEVELIFAFAKILPDQSHYLLGAGKPLKAVLKVASTPDCSVIFIADEESIVYSASLIQELGEEEAPWGTGVFDVMGDHRDLNTTAMIMSKILQDARKLRMASWYVIIVVLSEDLDFLTSLAKMSLKKRLLGYFTKMLIVSRLSPSTMKPLMTNYWTFSMMNSMVLNLEEDGDSYRWRVYTHFPYSPQGHKDVPLASWVEDRGLRRYQKNVKFFPDKFENFNGAVVNVTSLVHEPYWVEQIVINEDGTQEKILTGTDGFILHAVARVLNFSFYIIPAESWTEVKNQVIRREALMSPVYWDLVPERLEEHDMSYVYEYAYLAFCMAAPEEEVQWSSLYTPLANDVWLAILASTILASIALFLMLSLDSKKVGGKIGAIAMALQEIIATLLDQNFTHRLPESGSGRSLMVAWLMFSFVVGAAYRANLTAHLMLPSYQTRAETVEELVKAVDAITGETYLGSTKKFLKKSDYPPFKRVGELMEPRAETSAGMKEAVLNKRAAHVDFLKHMQHILVDKFTRPDGTTELYIGKSSISHSPSSWPMPHDAPYLPHVDKIIQTVVESGMIEMWYSEEIAKTQREAVRRQKVYQAEKSAKTETGGDVTSESASETPALTVKHMLGPFVITCLGVTLGLISFLLEIGTKACCPLSENQNEI